VSLSSYNNGSGGSEVAQVFVECGSGEQVRSWLYPPPMAALQ